MTGHPSPKGSMKCVGRVGKVRHQLQPDFRVGQKEWTRRCYNAALALAAEIGAPLEGPVSVEVTFTLELPKSVKPETRTWPTVHNSGDIDKLARLLLDAFTGPVWKDDSQVVELTVCKAYPHTPAPGAHTEPGALIRVGRTTT